MSQSIPLRSSALLSILFLLSSILFAPLAAQEQERSPLSIYLQALSLYNSNNLEEAEALFIESIALDESNDAAHYYLANIFIEKGEYKAATAALNRAIEKEPSNHWYKQLLAKVYSYIGENSKAIELYNQIRESQPHRSEFYDGLLELYIEEKEYEKALTILQEIEMQAGITEGIALTRFNLYIYENKEEEAYSYLKGVDTLISTPRLAAILGDYYAEKKDESLAEQYYVKALNLAPDFIPASFGLAELYRIQGKYHLYFQRMYPFMANSGIDSFMKLSYLKQIFTNVRFVQTFLPQVDSMMTKLYSAHPNDSDVAYEYALFLVQSDKTSAALKVLEKNLKENYQVEQAHFQFLSLTYYLEMWEMLLEESEKALQQFGKNTDFMEFKAIALLQMGDRAGSIKEFEKILKLTKRESSSYITTLTTLGDLNYQEGNTKDSFKYYKRAIRRDPNYLPALNNYAYFLALEGKQLNKALKMSKITIEAEPNSATYLDTYGWILHLLGENIEAKAIFKQALLYDGRENAEILNHYAHVLYQLKEHELAFMYWSQADKLDPSKEIALKVEKIKAELQNNNSQ